MKIYFQRFANIFFGIYFQIQQTSKFKEKKTTIFTQRKSKFVNEDEK